jgi:hypothetical protein
VLYSVIGECMAVFALLLQSGNPAVEYLTASATLGLFFIAAAGPTGAMADSVRDYGRARKAEKEPRTADAPVVSGHLSQPTDKTDAP